MNRLKALPLENVRVPRHTSSGGTSSATVYVPGAPGDAEVMAPFTLTVTDGTVTVPSPLKRISSTMALLRLDPLPPESADALLGAVLGRDASLDPLKQLLVARTGRNPLFIEESVQTLVETRGVAGGRGAYRLTQSVDAIQVPATVQAILASRIDRLPAEDKRLLEMAAVIGSAVPLPLLQAIAEGDDALAGRLGRLQAAEFLYETSAAPDVEYAFKHALTHEVAYSSVLWERRRELHARISAAIERLHGGRLT